MTVNFLADPGHHQVDVSSMGFKNSVYIMADDEGFCLHNLIPAFWIEPMTLHAWSEKKFLDEDVHREDYFKVGDVVRFDFDNVSATFVVKDFCKEKIYAPDQNHAYDAFYIQMPD